MLKNVATFFLKKIIDSFFITIFKIRLGQRLNPEYLKCIIRILIKNTNEILLDKNQRCN
jgi:hypothetical protein